MIKFLFHDSSFCDLWPSFVVILDVSLETSIAVVGGCWYGFISTVSSFGAFGSFLFPRLTNKKRANAAPSSTTPPTEAAMAIMVVLFPLFDCLLTLSPGLKAPLDVDPPT